MIVLLYLVFFLFTSYVHVRDGRVALPASFLQKSTICQSCNVLLTPEFSYCTFSASLLANKVESNHAKVSKPSSAAPLEHDHTYFKKKKGEQLRQAIEPAVKFKRGDKVMLMQKGKSVGYGTVTEGSSLHGHAIPQGYVKVVYIQPNTVPVFASSFDDEEMLTAGQFTAWPANNLNRMQSC